MIITIIGPRSVGKSTIAEILAKELNYKHINLDRFMEMKLGDIGKYTVKHTWEKWYKKREKFLDTLLRTKDNVIIDWSGGLEFGSNLLKKRTKVILLLPNSNYFKGIQTLYKRERKREHFKWWKSKVLKDKTKTDFYERLPLMKKTAHITIYRNKETPKNTALRIIKIINHKLLS